jgi:cytochrome c-type biogenesis protein CcmF
VVHVGIILLAIGVIGSNVYQLEADRTLAVGETMAIGAYTLTNQGLSVVDAPNKQMVQANLAVTRNGQSLGLLAPRKDLFRLREDQPMTIPGVMRRPLEDLYTLLGSFDPDTQRVTLKVYVNPLIGLVWLGMLTLVAGTLIAAWPDAHEARVMNAELERLVGAAGAGSVAAG